MSQALPSSATFEDLIGTRQARIGIVGLGYAGLPLAIAYAEAGFQVTGIDLDQERVAAVRERRSYLVDVPADRYADLDGSIEATSEYWQPAELDVITICVPTPLSKTAGARPQLHRLGGGVGGGPASRGPADRPAVDHLPGTTEEIVLPILEHSGRKVGEDFFLGFAPERVDPGNETYTLRNTPKLISGVTAECLRRIELLYRQIVDAVVPVSSTMVAETAKLHENSFRAINIGIANELALMCDRLGISAWEVIDAAATKPFGFLPHYPGPGLGGDCIPVVPHFLAWRLREYGYSAQIIDAAHEVNAHMPIHVLQKV